MTTAEATPAALRDLFRPAAATVAEMLRSVGPGGLDRPTPCSDWDLEALAGHALGTTTGLAKIGRKEDLGADPWAGPKAVADTWQALLADRVESLAAAWAGEEAWSGSVQLGVELPAATIGAMAYAEILLHGWDVARSVGAPLQLSAAMAAALRATVVETAELGRQMGAYGSEVAVSEDADDFECALATAGRDPNWTA